MLTERDLLWLQKIHEHGPLSSGYLHAFTRHRWRSPKRARDRLTDLFNETDTPHGGAYLDRPPQQFRTLDARYNDLVYALTGAGERALRDHGLWQDKAGRSAGPWHHRHMVACITASIEIGAFDRPDLNYIPQHGILERAEASLRYPVAFVDPATGGRERRDLIPDALFGLEYLEGGRRLYRFFLVEADRSTEPSQTSQFNRKSHLRTFLQYREYIGQQLYRSHLALSAPLLVLIVPISARTASSMLRLASSLFPAGNSYLLFQVADPSRRSFARSPVDDFLAKPWQRVGLIPQRLTEPM